MTARSRPPTDEPTEIYDGQPRRPRTPTKKGAGVELGTPTSLAPLPPHARPDGSVEIGTPTSVDPPPRQPPERAASEGARPRLATGAERSEPMVVISMKGAGGGATGAAKALPADAAAAPAPAKLQPRLRRLSEVSPRRTAATPPGGLGYLAPPRDPREARTRRWRDFVLWGSVVVILAGAVMLAVWFLAGM
ncbi:MAG TPA: hypothetical protein VNO30_39995 [Kofleriaceae bacterium]|nr:hypothetical protein [Kofleriaceae bacterium]